jgi:hypothetical protein
MTEELMDEVYSTRLALWQAHEAQDGRAALDALARAYKLLESLDEGQMLYVGDREEALAEYKLPPTARQLPANFASSCSECSERISKGTMFYWVPETKERICMRCGGVFFGMERQR